MKSREIMTDDSRKSIGVFKKTSKTSESGESASESRRPILCNGLVNTISCQLACERRLRLMGNASKASPAVNIHRADLQPCDKISRGDP